MAKKATTSSKKTPSKTAPVSTPVRNTPIPKVASAPVAAPAKKAIGYADIALRAYEIHLSGTGGDETSNWLRAERELRGV